MFNINVAEKMAVYCLHSVVCRFIIVIHPFNINYLMAMYYFINELNIFYVVKTLLR